MNVLILSAKTGGGHLRCAQALEKVITDLDPFGSVRIVDGLEYVNRYFNKFVVNGYKFSAMKLSKVYGMFYRMSNKDSNTFKMVQKSNAFFAKKLIPLIAEFKPDVIVTTHPFMGIMCSRLIEKGFMNVPVISIATDFALHASYINDNIAAYVVSSPQMVDSMEALGIDRSIVYPLGIPIDPVFFEQDEHKPEHLAELGFDPDKKTVLIMAGSFGVTDILKIYESINEIELDFQIIVITGKNMKLFDAFNSILSFNENMRVGRKEINFYMDKEPTRKEEKFNVTKKTKLIYFTDEVHKYMQISDLIITKPGGLTVTESLACCLPMALFRGIPGQETDNTEYLCDNNLAISIKKANAGEVVFRLLKYPERLLSMRESCNRLNNKDSAYNVYDLIKTTAEKAKGSVFIKSPEEYLPDPDTVDDEQFYTDLSDTLKKYELENVGIDFSDSNENEYEFDVMLEEWINKMKTNFKRITGMKN